MMPKTVTSLPKVAMGKQLKKENNKHTEFSFVVPLVNGKGSSHSIVAVPTDSKNFQFDIDTNIAIKTNTTTSRLDANYFLPRLLSILMLILVIIFWVEANSLNQQIYLLKNNMMQMNHDMILLNEHYIAQKLLIEQISERFDASRKEHIHYKCLVEREIHTTPGYETADYFTSVVNDSPETMTKKDEIMENDDASTKMFQLYDTEIQEQDSVLGTSTNTFGDTSFDYDDEEENLSESQRSPRNKRSNGRGKKASQKRKQSLRGPNIKSNISNTLKTKRILAVHLKGAFPDTVILDGGLIAPWYRDVNATGPLGLSRFNLTEGNGAVRISDSGLYYVYAQVYYLTNETINSYSINIRKTDATIHPMAYCSANASFQVANSFTDVTCFTSTIRYLKVGEQISLQQRERHRRILMQEGQTFLGLVRLEFDKGPLKM